MKLVDCQAVPAQAATLEILRQKPDKNLQKIRKLNGPPS